MRFWLWVLIALACLACRCHADGPKGVDDTAKHEVTRRGAWVEETGTIRSGLITAALAPPADDSGKWFVCLVGKKDDASFVKMKAMIESDQDIKAWINVGDPKNSQTHYQVRQVDDETQKDWFAGLKPAIDKFGLPAIVLQPPRSGQFGDPKTVVKMIHGVLTGKELSEKLRDGVITYVGSLDSQVRGIAQQQIGIAPPFNTPPANQPVAPSPPVSNLPFDWPPSNVPLSMDKVREACPGVERHPQFLVDVMTSKETNLELVKLKWQIYQKDHPEPMPAPEAEIVRPHLLPEDPPLNPTSPATGMPHPETLGFFVMTLVAFLCGWFLHATKILLVAFVKNGGIAGMVSNLATSTAVTMLQQSGNAQPGTVPTWKPPGSNANGSTTPG